MKADSENGDEQAGVQQSSDSNNEQEQTMEKLLSSFIGSLKAPCY